jgi:hypothetical protein
MTFIGRRQFITLLGGAATWSLAARAQQQPGKLPTIGFLGGASPSIESQRVAAFVQRLRDFAWIDGREGAGASSADRPVAQPATACQSSFG